MYSLQEAANATGKGKTTIWKAVKSGKVSAKKNDDGSYDIDPAELHRVYPPVSVNVPSEQNGTAKETPKNSALEVEVNLLRERIKDKDNIISDKDKAIDDLRSDRDHWREQAKNSTALLTHEREEQTPKPSQPPQGLINRMMSVLWRKAE